MQPGFARDQYGYGWLIIWRSGTVWALGVDQAGKTVAQHVARDNTITLDLSRPKAVRELRQVVERPAMNKPVEYPYSYLLLLCVVGMIAITIGVYTWDFSWGLLESWVR